MEGGLKRFKAIEYLSAAATLLFCSAHLVESGRSDQFVSTVTCASDMMINAAIILTPCEHAADPGLAGDIWCSLGISDSEYLTLASSAMRSKQRIIERESDGGLSSEERKEFQETFETIFLRIWDKTRKAAGTAR